MNNLIEHNCKEEGAILVEEGKPCNWCGELDEVVND